ncbi:ABC transporter, ATP-binding protein [Melissococcus plutonius]|uniref:ABC transporter, ATP-binding protein n=2 Tax=Melissococcus plutonius TaxID=33970 RepID=F3YAG3_MELPT|nr:ABC transporter ATP-binding protein [Melissococcus plutonius]AIM25721.1 ABC transporter, ATP-binding protein [Melissococcus plutonius S1]BAK21491.1 ABC transporter, ATP-binding protein [Melissococcus plutonius ATCC 35311]KMT25116.1 ABC transporter, ATP-binding protein [Melissococcus plutonius]KMT26753.1 ABC transporter, ATP-binding protein [Melissococcus plutonius]KMT28003.1 ABC transporter, ATP-binding protein [Melissococcus plutonius]
MMLKIQNLQVKYKDVIALDLQGEMNIQEDDIVGILGPNRAGKSTLIKAITNQVTYTGYIKKPKNIAVHLQENPYPNVLTCQTIMEGLLKTKLKKDDKLMALIEYFEFQSLLKKKVTQLSGGQKQKLTLIMVLYQDASLTCFDEMTAGLDFEARNRLMEKIQEWYLGKNATLLLVTHYFDEIEKLANKLLIINKGSLIDFGRVKELFKKYIGYSTIIVEGDRKKLTLPTGRQIISKKGKQAFSFSSKTAEEEVIKVLASSGRKFSISNNNVELIYLNAISQSKKC